MQTLTFYYVEFNYDMHVFNQVTDGHLCCYKLIIQATHPIEDSLLTFVCCWGNKLHLWVSSCLECLEMNPFQCYKGALMILVLRSVVCMYVLKQLLFEEILTVRPCHEPKHALERCHCEGCSKIWVGCS